MLEGASTWGPFLACLSGAHRMVSGSGSFETFPSRASERPGLLARAAHVGTELLGQVSRYQAQDVFIFQPLHIGGASFLKTPSNVWRSILGASIT